MQIIDIDVKYILFVVCKMFYVVVIVVYRLNMRHSYDEKTSFAK